MSRLDKGKPPNPKKGKGVTSFSGTASEVAESVKTAPSLADRTRQARAATDAIKGKGKPLGGAPPIDPEHMAALTQLPQPDFGHVDPEDPDAYQPPEREPVTGDRPPVQPPLGGVGSAYPVNQALARGDTDGPVSLADAKKQDFGPAAQVAQQRDPPKTLSSESVKGLSQMKQVLEGNAAAAPGGEEAPPPDETQQELDDADKKIVDGIPPIDFDALTGLRNRMMSPERKKLIEDQLEPLDIGQMISEREVRQVITVIPKKLEIELRTFNQHESLFCMQYVYDFPGSAVYIEELLNTCKLVCSLVAVNRSKLPEHRIHVGKREEEVSREAFSTKLFHVASLPVQLIADLSIQSIWFSDRVNDLFSLDHLKNG